MSITGYVFLFLTLLLAIVFPALAQPVMEYRQTMQKEYIAEIAKRDGKVEGETRTKGLLEEIEELEVQKARLRKLVALQEQRRLLSEELARRETMYRETQSTFLADQKSDSESRQSNWKAAIAQIEGEISARDTELKDLNGQVQIVEAFASELGKEISDLRAKLENARAESKRLTDEIAQQQKELKTLWEPFKNPEEDSESVAASRN